MGKRRSKRKRTQPRRAGNGRPSAPAKGHTEQEVQEAIRGTFANRFMFVRYLSAAVFFVNIYWTVFLLSYRAPGTLVTLLGLAASLAAVFECMFCASRRRERMRVTEVLYPVSAVAYLVSAVISVVRGADFICPFFSSAAYGAILCLVVAAVEAVVIWQMRKIRSHTDKRYPFYVEALREAGEKV